jgi:hypothetical protein
LYSIRRVSSAAYLVKRLERALWKWKFISKMRTAGLAAVRDMLPPAQPFISQVQHRRVIKYLSESASDFDKLKKAIEDRIKAFIKTTENLTAISKNVVQKTEGLDPNEIVALVTIGENIDNPNDGVSVHTIRIEAEKAGYTKIAITLALNKLHKMNFITFTMESDYNSNDYTAYHVTDVGLQWLLDNKDKLILKKMSVDTSEDDIDPRSNIPF